MKTILLVDESPDEANRQQIYLQDYTLVSCLNGEEAIARASGRPSVDLAIVLWELEGHLNGPETVVRLKQAVPTRPVIVISGLLDISRAATALKIGASDFLLKPIDRDRLRAAVARAFGAPEHSRLLAEIQLLVPGRSPAFVAALEALARVIPQSAINVLLVGETGTGKELLARAVHRFGHARDKAFYPINVTEIPSNLMESTLFGHEKGAFTGAHARGIGAFEEAAEGTLFLDEIGDMELAMQSKLLRVLQERTFRRVGGKVDLPFKARLVTATHRDLNASIAKNEFRRDLYHRICGYELRIPPLRERVGDLDVLIAFLLKKHANGQEVAMARETTELLKRYHFPGNVRELENFLKYAMVEAQGDSILPHHLPLHLMQESQKQSASSKNEAELGFPPEWLDLPHKAATQRLEHEFNRVYLRRCLQKAGGNMSKASEAARLDPKTFRAKCQEVNLDRTSLFRDK